MNTTPHHPHDASYQSRQAPVPDVDPRQLIAMTDDTGVFQHARLALPDPHHGYCVDDNARALIAACRLREADLRAAMPTREQLVNRYLTFVTYAVDPDTRCIRNFMSYDRRWLEPVGSNDSQGRTLWALGVAASEAPLGHQRELAGKAFGEALPGTDALDSLRAWAFLVIALDAWLASGHGAADAAGARRFTELADRLGAAYQAYSTPGWPWWESVVTYDNGRLPLAMLTAGRRLGRADFTDIGLASLGWLLDIQTDPDAGYLSVIGNDGWYRKDHRDARPAKFDQQPLEPAALIDACVAAYQATGETRWEQEARRCFAWYLGDNDLQASLIHPETGGCQDGLTPTAVNLNQGAESILSYLMSCQVMQAFEPASSS